MTSECRHFQILKIKDGGRICTKNVMLTLTILLAYGVGGAYHFEPSG